MLRILLFLLSVAPLATAGCFPRTSIPDSERQLAVRQLERETRYAKVALFVGPFFSDRASLLVADEPFDELRLLEEPDGKPIPPPPPERVLLPGTRVVVEKVEFPSGWTVAGRIMMTPRYLPWVRLKLGGESRPLVLVIQQKVETADQVRLEIERVFGTTDPTADFQALPEAQRAAIARKEPLEGMGPLALQMAWGYPARKVIDRPSGKEEWTWPSGKRRASLQQGRLVRWDRVP